MGKSKFQSKVQEKVGTNTKVKTAKSKYYDEHISKTQSSKSNSGFAIFVIICIIIGASVSGILIAQNKNPNNNGTDPNNNDTGNGIKDGDIIFFQYEFYMDVNHDLIFTEQELIDNSDAFQWKVEQDSAQGFPPGVYINILGMNLGQSKTFILDANVDEDGDGKDDITGEDVLSFGSGPFANTALKYFVKILQIN